MASHRLLQIKLHSPSHSPQICGPQSSKIVVLEFKLNYVLMKKLELVTYKVHSLTEKFIVRNKFRFLSL